MTISAGTRHGRRQDAREFVGSARKTVELIFSRRLIQPHELVAHDWVPGRERLVVFRETAVVAPPNPDPPPWLSGSSSAVGRNRLAHVIFRRECILHTPLFAGFAGFRPSSGWPTARPATIGRVRTGRRRPRRALRHHVTRLLEVLSVPGSVRTRSSPTSLATGSSTDRGATGRIGHRRRVVASVRAG